MAKASQEYSALRDRVVKEIDTKFRRSSNSRSTFIPADPGTWVDVALKGARGDGSTDNYEKVQRVLDASIGRNIRFSNSSRGGTVYGTSQPWQIPGPMNIHVMGGAELKFIGQPAMSHTNTIGTLTSTMAALMHATGVDGLTIRNDGVIDANAYHARFNPTGFTGTTGIVLQDCQHANVHIGNVQRVNSGCHLIDSGHCDVGHGYGAGYNVPAICSAEGIHDCTIHDLHGLFTHEVFDFNGYCYENTVTNCYGVNCVDEAFDINGSPRNKFSNLWNIFYPEGYSNFRGAWATATSYADTTQDIGDIVTYNSSYYRALTTHTSTALNGPGGVDTVWERFGAAGLLLTGVGEGRFTSLPGFGGSDDNEFDGVYGNVSPNASDNFIAIQAGVVPIQDAEFSCTNAKFKNVHCWGGGRAFFIDIGGDFDPADTATAWGTGEAYAENDIVEHNSLYWWALQAHTSAGANEPDTGGGDAFWRETVASDLTIDAVKGLEIEGKGENILREHVRFEGMAELPSTGFTVHGWSGEVDSALSVIYVENVTDLTVGNVKLPDIGTAQAGIHLNACHRILISDFNIAAGDTPNASGDSGILLENCTDFLIGHGFLRNFAGSFGGIALSQSSPNTIADGLIDRVFFGGNTYAIYDNLLAMGYVAVENCIDDGNGDFVRTDAEYELRNISSKVETWALTTARILAATAKTTPVDGDTFGYLDSAASNVIKRFSWANLKATLKTYFDTLYEALGALATHAALTIAHGATGAVAGTTNVQTFTGKSISGSTNTLTNIANSSLTNSSVTIGSTPVALGATAATVAGLTLTSPTINTPVIILTQGASVSPTAEGNIAWDTDDDTIRIGDGAGTKTFSDDSKQVQLAGAQTIAGVKTFSAGIILGAETLTTYDEGTYTPAITAGTTPPTTLTYTAQTGLYKRTNNWVDCQFRIQVATLTLGPAAGDIRISLPFTVATGSQYAFRWTLTTTGFDYAGTPIAISFAPVAGQAYGIILSTQDNAAQVVEAITGLTAGDVLVAQGVFVSA